MLEYAKDELRLIGRGRRISDRVALSAMSLRLHLAARGLNLPHMDAPRMLQLKGDVQLLARRSDYYALFEVLGLGCYDIDFSPLGTVESCLDVGANIGAASLFFAGRFPHARFVCVEPSPSSYALLETNVRSNIPGGAAIHAAVTVEPTMVVVEEGEKPVLTRVRESRTVTEAAVRGMTVVELLDEAGLDRVDLMKLDIEGGERDLLAHASTWAPRVGALLAEIHPPLTVPDAADQLASVGLKRVPLPAVPKFADLLLVARRKRPS